MRSHISIWQQSGIADCNDGGHQRGTDCYGAFEDELWTDSSRGPPENAISDGQRGRDAIATILEPEGQVQLHRTITK